MKVIKLQWMVLCFTFCSGVLQAQLVTDGSMGAQVTLGGADVEINQGLGALSGNNLFHSFQTFYIETGGSATFTGASDINNVISSSFGVQIGLFRFDYSCSSLIV